MSQKRRLCCPPEHSFHILKSEDNDFGHIHLENENDAGTFFSKVRDGEFCVEGRPINFLASRQAGSKDPILYKIDEAITSTIEPPTILNEPTTSEPSISIENFKEFGTGRLVEFLRNDKNLSELKLDDNFFTKIMEGRTFLKLTKSDLRECGLLINDVLIPRLFKTRKNNLRYCKLRRLYKIQKDFSPAKSKNC
ncbi:unnamed protein product [Rhizophagus irregularis]|nr:unnamed protein product [Rhizophagus irregularis]